MSEPQICLYKCPACNFTVTLSNPIQGVDIVEPIGYRPADGAIVHLRREPTGETVVCGALVPETTEDVTVVLPKPTPQLIGIYVASSWRNPYQERVVELLREKGYDVYDFKKDGKSFGWKDIDGGADSWTSAQYRAALQHPVAKTAYAADIDALTSADICVLVLPSGRSASFECGFHMGLTHGSPVVYMPDMCEPELMYSECLIAVDETELLAAVESEAIQVRIRRDDEANRMNQAMAAEERLRILSRGESFPLG